MDWKEVIAELGRLGVRQPQIAEACGCSQGAISLLATGQTKDPKHSTGEALRRLLAAKRREAAEKGTLLPSPHGGAPGSQRTAAGFG